MDKVLTGRASDGGMSLDELAVFVQQSMRDGAAGSEKPTVRTGFAGRIKRIDVALSVSQDGETRR